MPTDDDNPVYAYRQIADDLAAGIASGEITGRLPSERATARHYGVSYGTVRHAMDDLRDRGLIITLRSRGSFPVPGPGQPGAPPASAG